MWKNGIRASIVILSSINSNFMRSACEYEKYKKPKDNVE
jgi:hypothetical protein